MVDVTPNIQSEIKDAIGEKVDKLLQEVRNEIHNLLGTEDLNIDRDKLWELEMFLADTRILEAAQRGDASGLMAVVEFRERIIDRRYYLPQKYYEEKEALDTDYMKELDRLSKLAAKSEFYRQKYSLKLFEWLMRRVKLQDKYLRKAQPIRIVASAFLGLKEEVDMVD